MTASEPPASTSGPSAGPPDAGGPGTGGPGSSGPGTGGSGEATTPVRIHADREARTLDLEWADGHRTRYDFVALRWLCPCAYCRGEAGMPGWLDSAPTLTTEQTRLVDAHLVGNYAISPHWADGHHTGFYPFALLRDRCPCSECTARRARAADPPSPTRHGEHA